MAPRPILIGSEIYRRSSYGGRHPLAIPRVSAALDLIRAMGWHDPERYVDGPVATVDQLIRFHDPAYVRAVQEAEAILLKAYAAKRVRRFLTPAHTRWAQWGIGFLLLIFGIVLIVRVLN